MSKTLEAKVFLNPIGYTQRQKQKEAAKRTLELAKSQKKPITYLIKNN